jgi:hypothetical protein
MREKERYYSKRKLENKMAVARPPTDNEHKWNGLYSPIKRHRIDKVQWLSS